MLYSPMYDSGRKLKTPTPTPFCRRSSLPTSLPFLLPLAGVHFTLPASSLPAVYHPFLSITPLSCFALATADLMAIAADGPLLVRSIVICYILYFQHVNMQTL